MGEEPVSEAFAPNTWDWGIDGLGTVRGYLATQRRRSVAQPRQALPGLAAGVLDLAIHLDTAHRRQVREARWAGTELTTADARLADEGLAAQREVAALAGRLTEEYPGRPLARLGQALLPLVLRLGLGRAPVARVGSAEVHHTTDDLGDPLALLDYALVGQLRALTSQPRQDAYAALQSGGPGGFHGHLATELAELARVSARHGHPQDAVVCAAEEVALRRHLVTPDGRGLADLAAALTSLARRLDTASHTDDTASHTDEAAAVAAEALAGWRQVPGEPSEQSLLAQHGLLHRLGRQDEERAVAEASVAGQLAALDRLPPDEVDERLLTRLSVSTGLARLGRHEESRAVDGAADAEFRQLVEHSDVPELARLGWDLHRLGRRIAGLVPPPDAAEALHAAIAVRRGIGPNFDVPHSPLIFALGHAATRMTNPGGAESQLTTGDAQEEFYSLTGGDLTDSDGPDFLPAMARCLDNLESWLDRRGEREDRLRVAASVLALRRWIAEVDADRDALSLAGSAPLHLALAMPWPDRGRHQWAFAAELRSYASVLKSSGRHEDALVVETEAVAVRRRLAEAPGRPYVHDEQAYDYRSDDERRMRLAMALNNLAFTLGTHLRRFGEALPLIEEAVAICERVGPVPEYTRDQRIGWLTLAETYEGLGRLTEGAEIRARAEDDG